MKTRGLVFEGKKYWGPPGSAAPPLSLPDTSRFGNDGVFTNVTWDQLPGGLWIPQFNGTSSRITIPNFDLSGQNTIEILVIPNFASNENVTMDYYFWGWVIDGNHYTMFSRDATSMVTSFRYFVTPASAYVSTNLTWSAGDVLLFHTIMNPGGTFYLYLNAVVRATDTCAVSLASDSQTLYIGVKDSMAPDEFFDGKLLLLGIYNYVLTPDQISKHYEAVRRLFGA